MNEDSAVFFISMRISVLFGHLQGNVLVNYFLLRPIICTVLYHLSLS